MRFEDRQSTPPEGQFQRCLLSMEIQRDRLPRNAGPTFRAYLVRHTPTTYSVCCALDAVAEMGGVPPVRRPC